MKDRFGGYTVDLIYSDKDNDYLAVLFDVPHASISAFGKTKAAALKELDIAWALYKEDFDEEGLPRGN